MTISLHVHPCSVSSRTLSTAFFFFHRPRCAPWWGSIPLGTFFPSSIQSLSPHNGKPAREVLYSQSQVLQKCLITTTTTSADTGSKSVIKNTKNEPVVGRDIFYVACPRVGAELTPWLWIGRTKEVRTSGDRAAPNGHRRLAARGMGIRKAM